MSGSLLDAIAHWPEPNYDDPVTRGPGIIVAGAFFGAVGTVLVALRVYTRLRITSTFGLDDVFIIIAAIASLVMMVINAVASTKYGWNRHIWDVPFSRMSMSLLYNLLHEITFSIAACAMKISLLWFCRRLVSQYRSPFFSRQTLVFDASIVFNALCFVTVIIVLFLQCRPLKSYWDPFPTYHYECINTSLFLIVFSSLNSLTDLLTTLAPITLVWRIHLPRRQKIAVSLIFSLGVTVCISGAVRIYHIHVTETITNHDSTWVGWPSVILADVEIGLGLIVACAPALRPLLRSIFPRILEPTPTGPYHMHQLHTRSSQNRRFLRPPTPPPKDPSCVIAGPTMYFSDSDLSRNHSRSQSEGQSQARVAYDVEQASRSRPMSDPYSVWNGHGHYVHPNAGV